MSISFVMQKLRKPEPARFELPEEFASVVSSMEKMLEIPGTEQLGAGDIVALEELTEQIRINVNQLMDRFGKYWSRTKKSANADFASVKKVSKAVIDAHSEKVAKKDFSAEDFEKIECKRCMAKADYDKFVKQCTKLFSMQSGYTKDIMSGDSDIATAKMKDIMKLCKELMLSCSPNKHAQAGYDFKYTTAFGELMKKRTLADAGYKKGDIAKMIAFLKDCAKQCDPEAVNKKFVEVAEAYRTLEKKLGEISKESNKEARVGEVEKITLSMCRTYFYTTLIYHLYRYITGMPIANITNIINVLSSYEPEVELDDDEAENGDDDNDEDVTFINKFVIPNS